MAPAAHVFPLVWLRVTHGELACLPRLTTPPSITGHIYFKPPTLDRNHTTVPIKLITQSSGRI